MEILKIKVLENSNINEYLSSLGLGKHKINSLIDNNKIKSGKTILKQNSLINKDEILYIDITENEKIDYNPTEYNLDILYEDDYLLILNKPNNTIIYDEKDQNTLANYLRYYYIINNINRQIRHVHRLDKETTGVILYAKDFITHSALSKMLENNEITRLYHAEVLGKVNKKGTINKNIGKDRHINNKMIVSSSGQVAITHYKLLEYNQKSNTSLVEVRLETGRTHQIRVHFSDMGHPLVGDRIYNKEFNGEKLRLTSYRIMFIHPITKEKIDVNV